MGWWPQNEKGQSFARAEGGVEMVWGDSVADIFDGALDEIRGEFAAGIGRAPTIAEVRAGLEFSLGAWEEKEDGNAADTETAR